MQLLWSGELKAQTLPCGTKSRNPSVLGNASKNKTNHQTSPQKNTPETDFPLTTTKKNHCIVTVGVNTHLTFSVTPKLAATQSTGASSRMGMSVLQTGGMRGQLATH